MGANGITFRQGSLYVTSYDQGTIVRIPVRRNGAAGAPTVLAADEQSRRRRWDHLRSQRPPVGRGER